MSSLRPALRARCAAIVIVAEAQSRPPQDARPAAPIARTPVHPPPACPSSVAVPRLGHARHGTQIIEYFFGRCVFGGKLLASRDTEKYGPRETETYLQNKERNRLYALDYAYLFLNSFIEMIFIYNLFFFGANSNDVACVVQ